MNLRDYLAFNARALTTMKPYEKGASGVTAGVRAALTAGPPLAALTGGPLTKKKRPIFSRIYQGMLRILGDARLRQRRLKNVDANRRLGLRRDVCQGGSPASVAFARCQSFSD